MSGGPTRLHWIALALILALAAAHAWHRVFFIDDAYISLRYARNLVEGHGLVFNPHERVEGYTNFSRTLLVSGAMAAGLPPVLFSQMLGIAAALVLLLILYLWGLRIGMDPAWALLAPAMLAVNRTYAAWSTGGLETRWFTLLLVAAAFRLAIERQPGAAGSGRHPLSALLIGLACLTRPEGMLAAALAALGLIVSVVRDRTAERRRQLAGWLLTTGPIVIAHLVWRHGYYGEWLPNSFAAKVPGLRLTSGAVYLGLLFLNHIALV